MVYIHVYMLFINGMSKIVLEFLLSIINVKIDLFSKYNH